MKQRHIILASALLSLIGLAFVAHRLASGAWDTRKTADVEGPLILVAAGADGKTISARIQGEDAHAPSSAAESRDGSDAGKQEAGGKTSSTGDTVVSGTQKKSTVQVTSRQPVQFDDLSVSPFKGPDDAQVVMAVFSDFQ